MSRTNARKDAFCLLFQRGFVAHEEMESAKDLFFDENPEIEGMFTIFSIFIFLTFRSYIF